MKKILLLFAVLIMTTNNLIAQNANRSGVFLELQGGAALGDVIQPVPNQYGGMGFYPIYLKGGVVGSVDVGYRWATSSIFAIEAKVGLWSNFADFNNTYNLRIMPGFRITTKEIYKNSSIFFSCNIGAGYAPSNNSRHDTFNATAEISTGLNINKNIYVGLFVNYPAYESEAKIKKIDNTDLIFYQFDEQYNDHYIDYASLCYRLGFKMKNYLSLGLRCGIRF
jgi:hypothetical protein